MVVRHLNVAEKDLNKKKMNQWSVFIPVHLLLTTYTFIFIGRDANTLVINDTECPHFSYVAFL